MSKFIAIVEDEETIAANYRDALQRHGFRVGVFTNRLDAMIDLFIIKAP